MQSTKTAEPGSISRETLPSYVVISPARNEVKFITLAIESMIRQAQRPMKWVIVSDGSTDGTDEAVLQYTAEHPWIELVRMPERRERTFAGKVHAFNAGYERVRGLPYEVIACMDADISFDGEYFEFLLRRLAANPELGVVGTPFKEDGTPVYDYRYVNIQHVSGACQVFRRQCFEEIGGYVPVKGGGIDYIAVTTARMKGWHTRTFTEKVCHHHRQMGTAQHSVLKARVRTGVKDFALGNHPLWQAFRVVYQMRQKPYIVGGLAMGYGYLKALVTGAERPVSAELLAFTRQEQMQRLKRFVARSR